MSFEFTIRVRVDASRHIAKRIAGSFTDTLENLVCPMHYDDLSDLGRAMLKARGITVEVMRVTQVKEKGGDG